MLAVFDIDGVVADVRHRLHHLEPAAVLAAVLRRPPTTIRCCPRAPRWSPTSARQHEIVWLTGRPEWLRDTTARLARRARPARRRDSTCAPTATTGRRRSYKLRCCAGSPRARIAAFVDDDAEVMAAASARGRLPRGPGRLGAARAEPARGAGPGRPDLTGSYARHRSQGFVRAP